MATACSDYLETPPSVELDEDKMFADRTLAEKYLTGIYAQGLPLGFNASTNNTDRRLGSSSTLGSACDEAEDVADWAKGNSAWNVDNHNNNSIEWDEDSRFYQRWNVLRVCNRILKRVHEVPYDAGDPDFNKRATGEAYFMRAMLLWEGTYRYGGMPIIRTVLDAADFSTYQRNTFAQCIDSILVDCDRAAQILPDYYTDDTKVGRATRIAALALTLGMAIDSNVLINERIREELRGGMPPQQAINLGFQHAWATIVDSNLTSLIAGIALLVFGSGPVRGFAVVHCIGILTSMYSSVVVFRALVNLWYGRRRKLQNISIGSVWKPKAEMAEGKE